MFHPSAVGGSSETQASIFPLGFLPGSLTTAPVPAAHSSAVSAIRHNTCLRVLFGQA